MNETSSSDPKAATAARDYSKTLFLPQTDFPMRAGLPQHEPQILARWADMDLYRRLREAPQGRPQFVLHDGPPYANGAIHIGHALNKMLKDFVVRSRCCSGYDVDYVPGWDCHGLPIEWKIEEEYRAQGPAQGRGSKARVPRPLPRLRRALDRRPEGGLQAPGRDRRLGAPLRDHGLPGRGADRRRVPQVRLSGQLYRGSKPVMWCRSSAPRWPTPRSSTTTHVAPRSG